MIPMARPWFEAEEARRVRDVVTTGWLIQGPRVEAFERAFAARIGVSHAVAVNSGSSALLIAQAVLGVGPEDVWGHVFVAFSLSMIGDPGAIRERSQDILDRFTSTPTTDGVPPRVPGHRSLMARDAALARGTVDVDQASFEELLGLVEDDR